MHYWKKFGYTFAVSFLAILAAFFFIIPIQYTLQDAFDVRYTLVTISIVMAFLFTQIFSLMYLKRHKK